MKAAEPVAAKSQGVIACPDCGKQVSDSALTCPHCARPMKTAPPSPTPPSGCTGCEAIGVMLFVVLVVGVIASVAVLKSVPPDARTSAAASLAESATSADSVAEVRRDESPRKITNDAPVATTPADGASATNGVDAAKAAAPGSIEEYDERSAIIGKAVREFKFPSPEPNEFATMIALYDSNEAQAEKRYKVKMCREVGFVRQVVKDVIGATFVRVVGCIEDVTREGDVKVADCYFPKPETESVEKLKPSDRVIIRGMCLGKAFNRVFLIGCHVDEVLARTP